MNRLNALLYDSFVYRLLEWIYRISQQTFFFKVKVLGAYKPWKSRVENTFLYHGIAQLFHYLESKINESLLVNGTIKAIQWCKERSKFFCLICKIEWIYFLPFFVWIDRFLRRFNVPLNGLWDEAYMLLLFMMIGYRLVRGQKKLFITWIDYGLVLFAFGYLAITLANSTNLSIGLEGYRVVTQYLLTFFLVVQLLDSQEKINRFLWLLMTAISLLGLHGVYQFVTRAEIPSGWVDSSESVRTRAFSILGSPNALASIMVIAIPLGLSLFVIEKTPIKKLIAFGMTVVMSLAVLFTMSRGAWIAVAIALVIWLFCVGKRLIFPVMVFGGLGLISVEAFFSRVYYLLTPEYLAKSATGGRLFRYAESLELWAMNNQWFGVGVGRFGGAVATNHQLSPFYMDSFYLKTLTEAGILGLVLFIILILMLLWQMVRHIKGVRNIDSKIIQYGLLAGLIGVLLHNVVENIFEIPYMVTYFWAMAAVVVAIYRVAVDER